MLDDLVPLGVRVGVIGSSTGIALKVLNSAFLAPPSVFFSSSFPEPRRVRTPTPSRFALSTKPCAIPPIPPRASWPNKPPLGFRMMDVGSEVRIRVACTIARKEGVLPPSPYRNDPSSSCCSPKVRACAGAVCDATSGPIAAGSKIVSFLLIESARDRGAGISSFEGLAEFQNPKPVQLARLLLRLCFSVPRRSTAC